MGFQVETDVSKVTHIVMLRDHAYGTFLEAGTVLEVDLYKEHSYPNSTGHCYTKETEESCGYGFYIYDRVSFQEYFDVGFLPIRVEKRE